MREGTTNVENADIEQRVQKSNPEVVGRKFPIPRLGTRVPRKELDEPAYVLNKRDKWKRETEKTVAELMCTLKECTLPQ